jgi:hypothetical protein
MSIAILQLLPQGAGGFNGTRALKLDRFDQVRDTAQIILLVLFTGETLNSDCDS